MYIYRVTEAVTSRTHDSTSYGIPFATTDRGSSTKFGRVLVRYPT